MSEQIFHNIIYKVGGALWKDHTCGTGSLLANTVSVRENLPKIINQYAINSILDAPCGDYSWMSYVVFPASLSYIGGDIVSQMIDENKEKHPSVEFIHIDIVNNELPKVDLLFTRDLLIHLSNSDIEKTICNILKSKTKYWLVGTYDLIKNNDINTGHHRPVDLQKDPFNFPIPIYSFDDSVGNVKRSMSLWDLEGLRSNSK